MQRGSVDRIVARRLFLSSTPAQRDALLISDTVPPQSGAIDRIVSGH